MAHQALTLQVTDEEFDRRVLRILARELGAGDFARYLMRHRSGPGDYTRDRHLWLDGITLEDIKRELMPETVPEAR